MIEQELNRKLITWCPDVEFATSNGISLALHIDAFNNKMFWIVKWNNGNYKQFIKFDEARDYFLGEIGECNG